MSLNLSDIANKVRFGSHTLEILRGLIPDFPFEQVGKNDYPISFGFTDLSGTTHRMEYTQDDEVLENGDPVPLGLLYDLLYGIRTKRGQQAAITYEGSYTRKVYLDPAAGFNSAETLYFKNWFAPPYQSDNLEVEEHPDTGTMTINWLGPNGIILATKQYQANHGLSTWESYGVFRLNTQLLIQQHPAILIVQDPVTAQYLNDQDVPALTLPSTSEIAHYEYAKLFKSSEVYFALDQFSASYEYSPYPFAEHLMLHGIKVHVLQNYDVFSGVRVVSWVSKNGKQAFESALLNHSIELQPSEIPEKSSYNLSASNTSSEQIITPAQHFMGHGFAFKLDASDAYTLGPPLRLIKGNELLLYEGLKPDHSEQIESVVTQAVIGKIEHHQ